MVLNAIFNNISAISWPSVLLVEETGENASKFNSRMCGVLFQPFVHFIIIFKTLP
jgi:hypothetical protein